MAIQNGLPQWMTLIDINVGTNQDYAHVNGATAQTSGVLNGFNKVSQTLTAGPTTTGPVIATWNGVSVAIPFNVAVSYEKVFWDCLDATRYTHA